MEKGLTEKLEWIQESLVFFVPELILSLGIFLILFLGIVFRPKSLNAKSHLHIFSILSFLIFISIILFNIFNWSIYSTPIRLFGGMVRSDDFSTYLKIIFDVAGVLTVLMTWINKKEQKYQKYKWLSFCIHLSK